jgi:UrcA family protein
MPVQAAGTIKKDMFDRRYRMNRKMLVALAATAALALPTGALALDKNDDVIVDGTSGAETRTVAIKLRDLDLASAQGQQVANARIDDAARTLCTWKTGSVLPDTADYRSCYNDAMDSAQRDMESFARAQRQS